MSPFNSSILLATTIWPIHVLFSASLAFLSAIILLPHFWRSCNPGPTLWASVTDRSMTIKQLYYVSESFDEWPVKVAKTEKRMYVLNFDGCGPVSYTFHFYGVHACHPLFNDYPQIIHMGHIENAFFWLEKEVVPHCQLKYTCHSFNMVFHVGAGGHCNIVHVLAQFHATQFPFLNQQPENPIHHCLECRRRVTETKEHHLGFP